VNTRLTLGLATIGSLLLAGCRIDVEVLGEGSVSSPAGSFDCSHEGGDCTESYSAPGTEILTASAAQDYYFSRWKGCEYRDITSCETTISQDAVDNDRQWTITAEFRPTHPAVQAANYTYNALGQRITKTVDGVTTIFQYDLDGKLIAELDSSGQPLREHIHLDREPIAMIAHNADNTTSSYYVHNDHLGSPALLTDQQGDIRWDRSETPFGETYINYAEVEYNQRFPGQYHDGESGLSYNHFRSFNPGIGRYIQSDPVGLIAGLNTYAYVNSNPISFFDPDGLRKMGQPGVPDNDGLSRAVGETSLNIALGPLSINFGPDGITFPANLIPSLGVTAQVSRKPCGEVDGGDEFAGGLNLFGNGLTVDEQGNGTLSIGFELGWPVSITATPNNVTPGPERACAGRPCRR